MKLKLAGLQKNSVVDGPGLRTVVFAQGCPHGCPGCHNLQTQDPEGGKWVEISELAAEISRSGARGVTFSGGEPFAQARAFAGLAAKLKACGMSIVIYSGYTYEQLKDRAMAEPDTEALLSACDILIDGPFILAERDLSLAYRGSRNQRIIDLRETIRSGDVVLSPLHFRGLGQAYA